MLRSEGVINSPIENAINTPNKRCGINASYPDSSKIIMATEVVLVTQAVKAPAPT